MVRIIHTAILILAITEVRCQFLDFFSAFQPVHTTSRPYFLDLTTKRTNRVRTHTPKAESTTKRSYNSEELDSHKLKQKQRTIAPVLFDFYSTTVKPARKTTKANRNISNNYDKNKDKETIRPNHRDVDVQAVINNSRVGNRQDLNSKNQAGNRKNEDKIVFDDERNNIQYERPSFYDNKRVTTQNPYTIRPGVRPAVVNGPPITNKPPTRRPATTQDLTVTPELIIGPNEDFMNAVEKKRYIEMAEKMCDKYKALDIKQVEAIPLVPSPEPVRVNVSTCTPTNIPLVIGGKVVTIQEFPHMALLGWNKIGVGGYSWKCGGSLVSNQFVLTAAHCAYQERDDSVVVGPPRAVQLGSSYLDDQGAIVVKVAAVIRHPKYKLPKSYYDIALVKMVTTVTFSKLIKPACLGVPPAPGKPVIATGWGKTEFGGDQSEELRSVSVSVWNMDECYNVLGTSRKLPNGPMSDSQICAGEKNGGKDTCQGDSGGPAQIQEGCSWRVVAVTSLGRSCGAPHTPALYAKVQRPFVSAVVFGGQTGIKATTQSNQPSIQQNNRNPTQNTGWNTNGNTNQPSIQQNNRNPSQNTGWNANGNTNQPSTTWNTNSNNNQPTSGWNTNLNNNPPPNVWNTNSNTNQPTWNTNSNNNQNTGWNSNTNNQPSGWNNPNNNQPSNGWNNQNAGLNNNQQWNQPNANNGWNRGGDRNQNNQNQYSPGSQRPNQNDYYVVYEHPYDSGEDYGR